VNASKKLARKGGVFAVALITMTKPLAIIMGNLILPDEIAQLEQHFEIIKLWKEKDPESIMQSRKNDIEVIVAMHYIPVSKHLIESLPNLKIIATFSVGTDHIDLEAAKSHGVVVTNTPDILCQETADTGMSLLLAVARRIPEGDMFVRVGKWLNGPMPLGVTLANKKIGIVGLGGIGSLVAKRCEAFEMEVVYYGPRKKNQYDYTYYDDVTEMARDVDFLMLTCPGGEATANLIDANVLDALGPKGILINIARGSVVDEPALIAALQNGTIAAAGLDVFANEPHVPEEFISMDNVVLLPHIGSATVETRKAMGQLVVDNILAHREGKALLTEVKI
jgi:lactate dehydrogenase-like 2-hydroxyacid dehydrogenase